MTTPSIPYINVLDIWLVEFTNKNMCSLCGQSGVIDTRGLKTPAGLEVGKLNFCICPNGRALKNCNADLELWINHYENSSHSLHTPPTNSPISRTIHTPPTETQNAPPTRP